MKYNSKKVFVIAATICLTIAITGSSLAHSGRTDSNGGHKDNQNKSGLGSYHYHCGGYPAHLHENGICPYSSNSSTTTSSSSSSIESDTSTSSSSSSSNESDTSNLSSESSSNNSNSNESSKLSTSESVTTSSSVKTTSIEETTIKATSIEINEGITSMKVGETEKLTATITPTNTTHKDIKWESSDEDIATVSSTGKVVALDSGKVSITARTSNGKTDTIEITIEEAKEEINENDNSITPIKNNEVNNITTNTTENSDAFSGILGLGIIGGCCYGGYKKYKKSKK